MHLWILIALLAGCTVLFILELLGVPEDHLDSTWYLYRLGPAPGSWPADPTALVLTFDNDRVLSVRRRRTGRFI